MGFKGSKPREVEKEINGNILIWFYPALKRGNILSFPSEMLSLLSPSPCTLKRPCDLQLLNESESLLLYNQSWTDLSTSHNLYRIASFYGRTIHCISS
jgi:hypothetical protein